MGSTIMSPWGEEEEPNPKISWSGRGRPGMEPLGCSGACGCVSSPAGRPCAWSFHGDLAGRIPWTVLENFCQRSLLTLTSSRNSETPGSRSEFLSFSGPGHLPSLGRRSGGHVILEPTRSDPGELWPARGARVSEAGGVDLGGARDSESGDGVSPPWLMLVPEVPPFLW